jgi:hypothetical protein
MYEMYPDTWPVTTDQPGDRQGQPRRRTRREAPLAPLAPPVLPTPNPSGQRPDQDSSRRP